MAKRQAAPISRFTAAASPPGSAQRMTRLGAVIAEAIVHEYGRDELLRRLAHPFWFQSFGAVMGMDWHSSGITTSVIGALKRGLDPLAGELGLQSAAAAAGIRGRRPPSWSRPASARASTARALARASRLVAKVDSAAVQDGFDLYLHGFIVADDGKWAVVQQGMNGDQPPRPPLSLAVGRADSFVDAPHAAIEGRGPGQDRQPRRPPRRRLAQRAARPARRPRPRQTRPRGGRAPILPCGFAGEGDRAKARWRGCSRS